MNPLSSPKALGGRLQFQRVQHQGKPAEEQDARLSIGKNVRVAIHGALVAIFTCTLQTRRNTNKKGKQSLSV